MLRRDRAFDGRFVTGVLSTGIYCRPCCPARHPRRENVRFFASAAERARRRGCAPASAACPTRSRATSRRCCAAIDAIKAAKARSPLAELAERPAIRPGHFQRVFTRATGLSPAAYARALREERAREA